MPAGYGSLVSAASGRTVRICFSLENMSRELWDANKGICAGWQLFDPATSLFISEGEWAALRHTLAPGESAEFAFDVELPEQPGPYHVYVSARSDEHGWFYRQQWPFVLVEAEVAGGAAQVDRTTVTTLARARRRGLGPKLAQALIAPAVTLWRNQRLIASMVRREITARYRGSFGDVLWTVLHPLLLMLTYFFVFGIVMQARFGNDPSRAGFVLYFLAGMLPWLPFSEATGRAPAILLEHRNFVKKLVFPVETLPVNPALAGLVTEGFALLIFLALLFATRGAAPWTIVWLPALIVPQLMLTMGVCWFLSALGVYLRDLGQVIGFALTLVFFLTPICYPESSLPPWAIAVLAKSPIFVLVKGYRAVLLEGRAPALIPLAALWGVAIATFLAGHAWFWRLRKSFADVI